MTRGTALALFLLLTTASTVAAAQAPEDPPTASILQSSRTGVDEGTASAFDRMLRQKMDALGVAQVSGAVVLDLEQIQIALGCMGETEQCLVSVAGEVGVSLLVVPSLDRAGEQLVATVLVFDARDRTQRRARRSASGPSAATEILEGVEPMLRELFDLPPVAVDEDEHAGTTSPPRRSGISPLPFVLAGLGVAGIVGGAVAGALSESDASAYHATDPRTGPQIGEADSLLAQAQTEATAANVLFVAGGLLAAGGVVWLLAAGNEDGSSPLAIAPMIGPGSAGVVLAGTFGGTL